MLKRNLVFGGLVQRTHLLLATLIASRWVVYGFTDVALTAILRKSGVSLTDISLLMGVGFLFMFKFLWAPIVDRVPIFGVRGYKRWFLLNQAICGIALLGLLGLDPAKDFYIVFGMLVLASVAATFRDIATDGLSVKLLSEGERATANGWMSAGFMLGMVLGGGVLLMFYDTVGWQGSIWLIVLGTLIPIPIMVWFKEPTSQGGNEQESAEFNLLKSLSTFFKQPGHIQWTWLILLMAMAGITGPSLGAVMLIDNGWSLSRVGAVMNITGPLVAAALSLAAGYVFARFSRKSTIVSMLVAGAAMSLLCIPIAFDAYPMIVSMAVIVMSVVVASLTNIAQKVVVTDKSSATNDFGSNFTVQASLAQVGGILAHMAAPALASVFGYPIVLTIGGVIGLFAAYMMYRYQYL